MAEYKSSIPESLGSIPNTEKKKRSKKDRTKEVFRIRHDGTFLD